jgi:trigger factor
MTVVNVKTFVPAEENQETFDKIFGKDKVKDAEGFDKEIAARLESNYKEESDYRFSKDAKDYLLKKADIALPEAFLKRWLFSINKGKFTMEDIEKEFDQFLADYRWQMVRDALMKKYALKVDDKDMHEAAEAYVAYQYAMYGMPNVPEDQLHAASHQVLADEKQARQIEEQVEGRKVIAAVREAVSLAKKKISVEKFRELK